LAGIPADEDVGATVGDDFFTGSEGFFHSL